MLMDTNYGVPGGMSSEVIPSWLRHVARAIDSYMPFAVEFKPAKEADQFSVIDPLHNAVCGKVTMKHGKVTLAIDYLGHKASKSWNAILSKNNS